MTTWISSKVRVPTLDDCDNWTYLYVYLNNRPLRVHLVDILDNPDYLWSPIPKAPTSLYILAKFPDHIGRQVYLEDGEYAGILIGEDTPDWSPYLVKLGSQVLNFERVYVKT